MMPRIFCDLYFLSTINHHHIHFHHHFMTGIAIITYYQGFVATVLKILHDS